MKFKILALLIYAVPITVLGFIASADTTGFGGNDGIVETSLGGPATADIDLNGNVLYDSTQAACFAATACTPTHSEVAGDNIFGGSVFTSQATTNYFDNASTFAGTTTHTASNVMADNQVNYFGGSNDLGMAFRTGQTPNMTMIGGAAASRGIIFATTPKWGTDYAHANPANMTLWIQSNDETNIADFISFAHDQDDAVTTVGAGDFKYITSETKGQSFKVESTSETLTFSGGGGDATKTTSGLIPDGAWLKGITTLVSTTGTTCTSIDIGDGSDDNIFADNSGVTADDTSTNADATANFSNPVLAAAEVTITGVGGNCIDLVIVVTAFYETFTAGAN